MSLSYEFRFSVGLIQAYERDVTAHHFASPSSGCGRMTAKAESPPTNGNEMKVLRRTLWIWPNGASVLGGAFITDERDINGILMIPDLIDTRTLEIGVFLFQVPESFSEPRLLGFLLDLTFDRVQFFVGLRRLAYGRRCFHQPVNMTVA